MSACSACGAMFSCAMADGATDDQPCWCTQLPMLMPIPAAADAPAACYCPPCLRRLIAEKHPTSA